MASRAMNLAQRQVKPILSLDQDEARKRAINLYRAWNKQLPFIVRHFDIPKSVEQCRQILREEFTKHENLTDVRVIDMLIIKGQMELQESVNNWKQKGHIMSYFKETIEPKPKDFLSKFLQGVD
ncbi:hypothetical protein RN001_011948 [Aquatica leii]|uniref:NADH dehydrogenase [ubiquinone] 1 alpha subcomplex subunit 6 n=1 Tax=Aquatica leii TaxID=1421715 RepID=A0AAN7P6M0_9COLE|nr:hypothetical protein RN001_011948 [Aquatica leii]